MTLHLPRLPFALDPLIAEAKRRMRRRRYFVSLALVGVVAVAAVLTLGLRPGGFFGRVGVSSVGINASPSEVAAIERALRTSPSFAAVAQLWFTEVRISTVDPRYAYVHLRYTAKCPGCTYTPPGSQGGLSMVRRDATGWHEIWVGSMPPFCGVIPTGVRKEIFGTTSCPAKP